MTPRDALTDLPGQIVDGKYRVETLLGRGGMGAWIRAGAAVAASRCAHRLRLEFNLGGQLRRA